MDSPFMEELRQEAEIIANGGEVMTVNGSPMGRAIWNLIVSKRDLSLYCTGPRPIKPHRHWKVTDVKKYFGIKGTGQKLYDNFMALHDDILGALGEGIE
tara:strand:- start:2630 stop:2926 length:297 start_codon:yes stop_codon:yes gene_type:complete